MVHVPELYAIYAVWKRELLVYIREKERLVSSFVSPLLWLFVFGSGIGGGVYAGGGTENYQSFIFPGILTMSVLFISVFYGLYIIWDRKLDFLKEVLVAPISRSSIFLGKTLGGVTDAMIQGVILLVIGSLFILPVSPVNFLAALAILFLLTFFTTSLGLIMGANLHSQEGFALVSNFLMWPMFFFSGALFPVSQLPDVLKAVSDVNPLTYAVDALRFVLLGQSTFSIYLDVGVLALSSVILGIAGVITFGDLQQAK